MPDIFISYSRKDSAQALVLTERLRADGFSIWLDQTGISGAEKWSAEIVDAIESASAIILLISPESNASPNVHREISLASEQGKHILPVDLAEVTLSRELKYPLAGLQRIAFDNTDAILKSLKKLGVVATSAPPQAVAERKDTRKSLIILPFEDLSPAGEDNLWFADGLAGELIDALGHIKSLRILDRKTSLGLRKTTASIAEIGRLFNSRYFIEGNVRKFGEQIKISVSLLDIETGDYLWQESLKGKFEEIFEIQESVAQKVVQGLKLHLTKEEKSLLEVRGTENAEAYELIIKAQEYNGRQTKEGFQLSIQLLTEAIKLDPGYATAYSGKANSLAMLYRAYVRDPALLEEGIQNVKQALTLKPDLWGAYYPLSLIYQLQGKLDEAEKAAKEYIRNAPDSFMGYFALGFFYSGTSQHAKAIEPYEKSAELNPENLPSLLNLITSCASSNEKEKQLKWSAAALPRIERHLKLHPDDEGMRVFYATVLFYAGRLNEARQETEQLGNIKDGRSLYNTACLQNSLQDHNAALKTFRKAIEAGYRNMSLIDDFFYNDVEGLGKIKGTREWEEVRELVEAIKAEQKIGTPDRSSTHA